MSKECKGAKGEHCHFERREKSFLRFLAFARDDRPWVCRLASWGGGYPNPRGLPRPENLRKPRQFSRIVVRRHDLRIYQRARERLRFDQLKIFVARERRRRRQT